MLNEFQLTVAGSMRKLLDAPKSIPQIDERLFEGLLAICLNVLPGLAESLGVSDGRPGSRYTLGRRGYPDIVRISGDGLCDVGIEVKLRSQHNLQSRNSPLAQWQLDAYADRFSDGADLLVVAPAAKNAAS